MAHAAGGILSLAVQKLLLNTILIVTVVLPIVTGRKKDRKRAAKEMVKSMTMFLAFYVFALLYIYPRLEGK